MGAIISHFGGEFNKADHHLNQILFNDNLVYYISCYIFNCI